MGVRVANGSARGGYGSLAGRSGARRPPVKPTAGYLCLGRLDATTGLYQFRRRDESPALGRWTQVDASGFDGGDVNLYRNEAGAPVGRTDPSGSRIIGEACPALTQLNIPERSRTP